MSRTSQVAARYVGQTLETASGGQISSANLDDLIATARAVGVEVDDVNSLAWLQEVQEALETPGEFAITPELGYGGHELAVLDFDPKSADRLRRIGTIIAVPRSIDGVRSALAIAGSAAQGRIQPFPADTDYFERVHLLAPTLDAAQRLLADVLRANVLNVEGLPGFRLNDVWFGRAAGGPLRWTAAAVRDETIMVPDGSGRTTPVRWNDAAADPGFVKLDWLLTEPSLGGPGKVTKVVDATWGAPDGSIVSLDGMIDADFQQIYLDAEGAEMAASLTGDLATETRDHYLRQIEGEISKHYHQTPPNFAKVAKRLYNICRLTLRHDEAVFLRELFDEPSARLDQIRTRMWVLMTWLKQERSSAESELGALLDELAATWLNNEDRAPAAIARQRLVEQADDVLAASISELDAVLARLTSRDFERRLRAYPPVYALIEEILARQSNPDAERE